MPKIIVGLVLSAALIGQVTTIPAPSGGGGAITAGRVAFGDGTSTAATDSQFVWDNTNKRFQVGGFIAPFTGLESNIKSSVMVSDTAAYGSYKPLWGEVINYSYGNGSTGVTSADITGHTSNVSVNGNADFQGGYYGGITAYSGYVLSSDTSTSGGNLAVRATSEAAGFSVVDSVTGLAAQANANGSSTVSDLIAVQAATSMSSTVPATRAYGLKAYTGAGALTTWNIYSSSAAGSSGLHYLGGNTGIGNGSSSPTQTLLVKDGTTTTGATTIVFDLGDSQSSTSTILTLGGVIRFNGQNTTGAGSAALGSNSPAVTNTAPYTWIRAVASDGSTIYLPAWK